MKWKRQKRQRRRAGHSPPRRLGAIETERTGTVKLDQREITRAVADLVRGFRPCSGYNPRGAFIEGVKAVPGGPIVLPVKDAGSGEKRPVEVFVTVLDHEVPVQGATRAHTTTRDAPWNRLDQTVLTASRHICMPPVLWKEHMRSVLAHELTHASDPYVPMMKRSPPMPVHPSRGDLRAERAFQRTYCAYVNHPVEARAFLNSVRLDLLRPDVLKFLRQKKIRDPALALQTSEQWAGIEDCVRGRLRRRFLQMAARTLGPQLRGEW